LSEKWNTGAMSAAHICTVASSMRKIKPNNKLLEKCDGNVDCCW
jgi:hypothetical protein